MKINHSVILSLILVFLAGPCLATPQDDDRLFGQGRFLRRIRERFSGPQYPPKPPPTAGDFLASSKRDSRSSGRYSTKPSKKDDRQAGRSDWSSDRDRSDAETRNRKSKRSKQEQTAKESKKKTNEHKLIVLRSPDRVDDSGFGMELILSRDRMIVGAVQSGGSAEEAGIREGDELNSVGGAAIETVRDFDEIASLLKAGDRVEFGMVRKKKSRDVVVEFQGRSQPDKDEEPRAPTPADPRAEVRRRQAIDLDTAPEWYPEVQGVVQAPSIAPNSGVESNQQIIRDQQEEIAMMKRELERLRAQTKSASILEGQGSAGSIESGPAILPDRK